MRAIPVIAELLENRQLLSGQTIVVNTAYDGDAGGQPADTTTLRQAIAQANSDGGGDTITFDSSLSGQTITLTQGELDITSSLTITGLGAGQLTISGGWSGTQGDATGSRIFHIDDGTSSVLNVTITGLSLTRGYAPASIPGQSSDAGGGAIKNNENLILTDDSISQSAVFTYDDLYHSPSGNAEGGGIYNSGTITATRVQISNNTALAENPHGGGLFNSGTFTSTDNQIFGNQIVDINIGRGGGIYNSGTFISTNDSITGNSGHSNNLGNDYDQIFGAGFFNDGTATITNDVISGNSTAGEDGDGGGLYNEGTVNSINNIYAHNTAQAQGNADGGGVSNRGNLISTNDTFAYNSAISQSGGGSSNGGGLFIDGGQTTLVNATISGNRATSAGAQSAFAGGLYGFNAIVNVVNSIIVGNRADGVIGGSADTLMSYVTGKGLTASNLSGEILLTVLQVDGSGTLNANPLLIDNGGPNQTIALAANSPAINSAVTLANVTANGDDGSVLTVDDTTYLGVGVFLRIGQEIVQVTSVDANAHTVTVLRAQLGTTQTNLNGLAVNLAMDNRGYFRIRNDKGSYSASSSPDVQLVDSDGEYTGDPIPATATLQGFEPTPAATLEGTGLTLTYYVGSSVTGTPLASAPTSAGTYTVVASFAGSAHYPVTSSSSSFVISRATPILSLTAVGGTFNNQPHPATATVAGVDGNPDSLLEGISPTLKYYSGTRPAGTPLAGAPTAAGTYTVVASFAGSANYGKSKSSLTYTIAPAQPTVSVVAVSGAYSGNPFSATGTVTGLSGVPASTLEGIGLTFTYYSGTTATGTPLAAAPTSVGTYTVVASFAGSASYASNSQSTTFSITAIAPTITLVASGGPYTGNPISATGAMTGLNGVPSPTLEGVGLTFKYYAGATATGTLLSGAPTATGTYTVLASFAGSANYTSRTRTATFTISDASPTISVSVANGIFTGAAFPLTASIAGLSGPPSSSLEGVGLTFVYYFGPTATGTPLSNIPTAVGTYTVVASFAGSLNYIQGSRSATFSISPATPTITLTTAGGTANGSPVPVTATIAGRNGIGASTLEGVGLTLIYYSGPISSGTPLQNAPSTAGTYTVVAKFAGSKNYLAAQTKATFTISTSTPTLKVVNIGGVYNGDPFPATATIAGGDGTPGDSLEGVGLNLAYYAGTTATGTPLAGAPSNVGTYTVVASFAGSASYRSTSKSSTFRISAAIPKITLTNSGGIYKGSPFPAKATLTQRNGTLGGTLEGVGLVIKYYAGTTATGTPLAGAPSAAGIYIVVATFAGSANYSSGSVSVNFKIVTARPALTVVTAGGAYTGSPIPVMVKIAGIDGVGQSTLEGVGVTFTYYAGATATGTPLSGAPVNAGTYTAVATFAGSANYSSVSKAVRVSILQAAPTITLTGGGGAYTGNPLPAQATVTGVNGLPGQSLDGVDVKLKYYAGLTTTGTPLNSAPVNAGTYTVVASFVGSQNYTATSKTAKFQITAATSAARSATHSTAASTTPSPATAISFVANGLSISAREDADPPPVNNTGAMASSSPPKTDPTTTATNNAKAKIAGIKNTARAVVSKTFSMTGRD